MKKKTQTAQEIYADQFGRYGDQEEFDSTELDDIISYEDQRDYLFEFIDKNNLHNMFREWCEKCYPVVK